MTPQFLTAVVITVYLAPNGAPLYCDRGNGLAYNDIDRWIAWDFAVHGGQCGDWIDIIDGGIRRRFRALDSGRFGLHCVRIGDKCPRIVADLPAHLAWFPGISLEVDRVWNVSAQERRRSTVNRLGGLVQ